MFFKVELTQEQYTHIKDTLPVQRGNVRLTNLQVLNAILYVAEHGCKWRGLPKRFGRWHTIYTRMNRWAKNGVLTRVFEKLPDGSACADSNRSALIGLDFGEGTSGWTRRFKKKWPASHRQVARRVEYQ